MTYLSDLKKLALAGAYHYAPDDILRLIAVIDAAKAMRADPTYRSGHIQALDAALAELERGEG